MTRGGTSAYRTESEVPQLVQRAVRLALSLGFENSCLPEQGRLLQALVRGRPGAVIGETGTGCGVGLAWIVSATDPSATVCSVEQDHDRAASVTELFAELANVTVLNDDWRKLLEYGPFDILVLDGGGSGKRAGEMVDPAVALAPGGSLIIDDFSPRVGWPPTWHGAPDTARLHWLEHPQLLTTEITLTPDSVTIIATRR